jgi:hypothetical protein
VRSIRGRLPPCSFCAEALMLTAAIKKIDTMNFLITKKLSNSSVILIFVMTLKIPMSIFSTAKLIKSLVNLQKKRRKILFLMIFY